MYFEWHTWMGAICLNCSFWFHRHSHLASGTHSLWKHIEGKYTNLINVCNSQEHFTGHYLYSSRNEILCSKALEENCTKMYGFLAYSTKATELCWLCIRDYWVLSLPGFENRNKTATLHRQILGGLGPRNLDKRFLYNSIAFLIIRLTRSIRTSLVP